MIFYENDEEEQIRVCIPCPISSIVTVRHVTDKCSLLDFLPELSHSLDRIHVKYIFMILGVMSKRDRETLGEAAGDREDVLSNCTNE